FRSASMATGPVSPAGPTAVTVGGVAIPKLQIDTLAGLMARARGIEPNAQQSAAMRRAVATNLIGQELLELEAKAAGVRAEPAEIDSALNLLKGQFPDAASWREAMRRSGDTETEVRAKIARQIRADKVLAANVAAPEPPTEAELRAFWEANRKEFPVNDSLRALQIL